MVPSLPVGCWAVDGGEVCRETGFGGEERGGGEGNQETYRISFWEEDLFPQTLSLLMAESRSYSPAPGL